MQFSGDSQVQTAVQEAQTRWIDSYEVDHMLGELIHDPFIEAFRPALDNLVSIYSRILSPTGPPRPGLVQSRRKRLSSSRWVFGPKTIAMVDSRGGVTRMWITENQRLAVAAQRDRSRRWRYLTGLSTASWKSYAEPKRVAELVRFCAATGVPEGGLIRQLDELVGLIAPLERHLSDSKARTVVIGAPQEKKQRIAAYVARSLGICTVYIPHAPTSLSRFYADLPFDWAFLRGDGDADYYRALGASSQQIHVVGDPMLQGSPTPKDSGQTVVLFCPGLRTGPDQWSRLLERLLGPVREHEFQLVLAPHPRGRDAVRHLSSRYGVDLLSARTSSALASGTVAGLISEMGSGVLLEAEHLGVPSATFGQIRSYAFEFGLDIPRLSDARCVDSFLGLLASSGVASTKQVKAGYWVSRSGQAAQQDIASLLDSVAAQPRPVLRHWATGF